MSLATNPREWQDRSPPCDVCGAPATFHNCYGTRCEFHKGAIMVHLRKLARGKPCMVRLPGICNGNPETTVLAHYRLAGYCGTGMKPPDVMGAWACSDCHDAIDRRNNLTLEKDFVRLAHAEGVLRTLVETQGSK